MSDITKVTKDGQTYALFFSKSLSTDGIKFLTEDEDAFQVGLMEREAGYTVEPHQHSECTADIRTTSEFLYVEKGKVLVKVYDEAWEEIGQKELSAGDFLLFLRGGHGLEVLEPARIVEVKQGPFLGDPKVFRSDS
jgi:hypothetical protein